LVFFDEVCAKKWQFCAAGINAGMTQTSTVSFARAERTDADALASLRVEAMRESLENIGRFDEKRARDRILSAFDPHVTFWAVRDAARVGFFVLKTIEGGYLLDHLYVAPAAQKSGIGGAVLAHCFAMADAAQQPIFVGALRESASNTFYQLHGFMKTHATQWDVYYVRKPS
jgi:GNAT superfamily N-acetyltransferase